MHICREFNTVTIRKAIGELIWFLLFKPSDTSETPQNTPISEHETCAIHQIAARLTYRGFRADPVLCPRSVAFVTVSDKTE